MDEYSKISATFLYRLVYVINLMSENSCARTISVRDVSTITKDEAAKVLIRIMGGKVAEDDGITWIYKDVGDIVQAKLAE